LKKVLNISDEAKAAGRIPKNDDEMVNEMRW